MVWRKISINTYRHRFDNICTEISKHFPGPQQSQWQIRENPSFCSICPWSPSAWWPALGQRCWSCSRGSGSHGGSDCRPWPLSPVGASDCEKSVRGPAPRRGGCFSYNDDRAEWEELGRLQWALGERAYLLVEKDVRKVMWFLLTAAFNTLSTTFQTMAHFRGAL